MNFTLLTTAIMAALITLSAAAPAVTPAAPNVLTDPPMACYNIYCNPEVDGNAQCISEGCSKCVVGVNKCG